MVKTAKSLVTNTLIERLKATSVLENTVALSESAVYNDNDMVTTNVPAINVAMSGKLDGGFFPGITMFAGPSKHFKTMFSFILVRAYLDKYPDAVCIFYDSEFGTPMKYLNSLNIDVNRVLHTPITSIEELKFDLSNQLKGITRGERVIIIIDSIGNIASNKEIDDSLEQKSSADMTRAKQLKSLFRIATPHLPLKNIPMILINHTYKTMEMFSRDIVSGGTGAVYSANNIFIVGRQQEKDDKELKGYNFILNVEKSRFLKEKSKIPISISFEEGINRWSYLLELAVEAQVINKVDKRNYALVNLDGEVMEQKFTEKQTNNEEFWKPLLDNEKFKEYVKEKFLYNDIF